MSALPRPVVSTALLVAVALLAMTAMAADEPPIDWTSRFTAQGITQQTGSLEKPWCKDGNYEAGLGICSTEMSIAWAADGGPEGNNASGIWMYTSFDVCLPLLTEVSGSGEPCSYYFFVNTDPRSPDTEQGVVFYEYEDQVMTASGQPTSGCCTIENFFPLVSRFPSNVKTYSDICYGTGGPQAYLNAHPVTLLGTPGEGFYALYEDITAGNGFAAPNGFGGATPGSFTQQIYTSFAAFEHGDMPPLPASCQPGNASYQGECVNCSVKNGAIECGPTLSELYAALTPIGGGGCGLCHTLSQKPTCDSPQSCCPSGSGAPASGAD